jgi:hypothetical protein
VTQEPRLEVAAPDRLDELLVRAGELGHVGLQLGRAHGIRRSGSLALLQEPAAIRRPGGLEESRDSVGYRGAAVHGAKWHVKLDHFDC